MGSSARVGRQLAGGLVVLQGPDADFAREVADEDAGAVVGEVGPRVYVGEALPARVLVAFRLRDWCRFVATAANELAGAGVLDRQDAGQLGAGVGLRPAAVGLGVDRSRGEAVLRKPED